MDDEELDEPLKPPSGAEVIAMSAVVELGMALVAWFMARWLGVDFAASFGSPSDWFPWGIVWGVVATIPLVVVLLGGTHLRWGPLVRLREVAEDAADFTFRNCRAWHFGVVGLLAGFGEEILFRGFVQVWGTNLLGFIPGLLAASLLFGLAHPLSTGYVVVASILGAYLGVVFYLTGNLAAPIIAHALYDFAALAYLRKSGQSAEGADAKEQSSE